jgi:quercetin dioxygenase-like cupin family protein
MDTNYSFFQNIGEQLTTIPADSIVSRSLLNLPDLKTIVFGFAPGQELSEHTAARPALLHFVRGEAKLTLGQDSYHAQAGTFVYMPAQLPHSVYAETEVVMLLLMLPANE